MAAVGADAQGDRHRLRAAAGPRASRPYLPLIFALGTLFGLASAWGHSFAYLASRDFTQARPPEPARGSAFDLLVMAHVLLGGAAAVLFVAVGDLGFLRQAAGPLLVSYACFLVAQSSLFATLSRVEASTVAPLLSLKIAALAGLSWWIQGRPMTATGALAIALAIAGAVVVGGVGQRPDRRSVGILLLAVAAYAGCDMGIVQAIERTLGASPAAEDRLVAALRCMGALYTAFGLLALTLLPGVLRRRTGPAGTRWRGAAAYAACWAGAMATLFAAFSLLPVVLVAILQSTRSLWSVVLGGWLGRVGFGHLETDHGNGTLAVRVAGAVALVIAVGLYGWSAA